jgi:HAD superfamily hydrolase (TIGR01509 family)
MRDIKGIIFDCDGTLADTMPLHWKAWQVISLKYGIEFPESRFYALGGVPTRQITQMLAAEQGLTFDVTAVAHEKDEAYLPFLPTVQRIEPVVQVAREAYGKIPLAVASGGTRPIVERVLEHCGILSLFAAIVTSEDVVRQKPAPDIFLEAARRIGIPAENCRGYEDTDLGMEAIIAAGMDAVDVRPLL